MLTLTAALSLLAERAWERRTRREIALCNRASTGSPFESAPPPLLIRWLEGLPVGQPDAAAVYAWHFEAEMAMTRRFTDVVCGLLVAADLVRIPDAARGALALAVVCAPVLKRLAQQRFNEVEAALPLVGTLALLREREVVWSLASVLARQSGPSCDWAHVRDRLTRIPVPTAGRRDAQALDLASPRPMRYALQARASRQSRLDLQQKALRGLVLGGALMLGGLLVVQRSRKA
ncbi:MAG: hypothetical protein EB084_23940 [Proteobacteria bacterium]|nr:hypothetical protein [Pseudomonadota bacterium]